MQIIYFGRHHKTPNCPVNKMAHISVTIQIPPEEDKDGNPSNFDPLRQVLQQLLHGYDPNRPHAHTQYLLQHAQWQEVDSFGAGVISYGAFSDISSYYGDWPLYDLSIKIKKPGSAKKLKIHSWKGDFDPNEDYQPPRGNLPYTGPHYQFSGTIWTRG